MQKLPSVGKFHFEPPSRFTSLDYLVGGHEKAGWHAQTERLGRLEVEDCLVLYGCLHRHVSGMSAAQDTVNKGCHLPERIDAVGAIGHETTGLDPVTRRVHRR